MSQQDHHSLNQGLFAGRRVAVVRSDALNLERLVGQQSVLRYQDAGVITAQQMSLLQRLLPRERLESLLTSLWFRRRLDTAMTLSRAELQQILRLARSEQCDWMQQLWDRVNLADLRLLWQWVLYPLRRWWVLQLEPEYLIRCNEQQQLQVMRRQLNAQSIFWQTVADAPNGQEQQIALQLAQLEKREEMLLRLQQQSEARLRDAWPAWYGAEISQLEPAMLMPVPDELAPFWQDLLALADQAGQAEHASRLHEWLASRGLALGRDHFYWQPRYLG